MYFKNRIANYFLSFLVSLLTNINFSDVETGYKAIKTNYIRELDNIDSLCNASSSDLKMMDDCSYIAVGHRSSRPWITKFNELGEEIWSKTFDGRG